MQRICSKFRAFSQISTRTSTTTTTTTSNLIGHSLNSASNLQKISPFSAITAQFKPHFNASATIFAFSQNGVSFNPLGLNYVQMRNFSAKSKEKKWKKLTPATSKVKKIKMKTLSALKGRFKTLSDGTIRRWREGKRHNAHLKSKKSKRRLRKPALVPAAYAKVMKKMNFCAHY